MVFALDKTCFFLATAFEDWVLRTKLSVQWEIHLLLHTYQVYAVHLDSLLIKGSLFKDLIWLQPLYTVCYQRGSLGSGAPICAQWKCWEDHIPHYPMFWPRIGFKKTWVLFWFRLIWKTKSIQFHTLRGAATLLKNNYGSCEGKCLTVVWATQHFICLAHFSLWLRNMSLKWFMQQNKTGDFGKVESSIPSVWHASDSQKRNFEYKRWRPHP